jgi:hypothetical protein
VVCVAVDTAPDLLIATDQKICGGVFLHTTLSGVRVGKCRVHKAWESRVAS